VLSKFKVKSSEEVEWASWTAASGATPLLSAPSLSESTSTDFVLEF
jgi:hypothetical protein